MKRALADRLRIRYFQRDRNATFGDAFDKSAFDDRGLSSCDQPGGVKVITPPHRNRSAADETAYAAIEKCLIVDSGTLRRGAHRHRDRLIALRDPRLAEYRSRFHCRPHRGIWLLVPFAQEIAAMIVGLIAPLHRERRRSVYDVADV